ncbi:MAG: efflux RND transporter periplasmic adaptor subunit [Sandaracinaceae bacterium]
MRKHWGTVALVLVVASLLTVVARTAIAGPQTAPRESDRAFAARTETPPGQLMDTRLDRPEGDFVGGLGIVEPREPETRLSPAVAGRVAVIHVTEGQVVEAGALLVELESGPEQAALAAAEAEVAVAAASLLRSRRGLRAEDLDAITRESEAASARAQLSEGVVARLEAAAQRGAVTGDEVERARRQAEADRALLEASRAREAGGRSGRREDVLVATAQLRAAEARRDQARAALERLRIVAPAAGEILEIRNRVGEYVVPSPTEALVVLGDTSRLRARLDIDERDVARVRVGAEVIVRVDAFPGRDFRGRVVELGRRMGRKVLRTDEPTERIDTKILETVVELEAFDGLIPGIRVMGYVRPA